MTHLPSYFPCSCHRSNFATLFWKQCTVVRVKVPRANLVEPPSSGLYTTASSSDWRGESVQPCKNNSDLLFIALHIHMYESLFFFFLFLFRNLRSSWRVLLFYIFVHDAFSGEILFLLGRGILAHTLPHSYSI